jgi:hypothetical protein
MEVIAMLSRSFFASHSSSDHYHCVFSMLVRSLWFLLLAGTLVSELVPLSL